MRFVRISESGSGGTKGLAELNQLSKEDESKQTQELIPSLVEIRRPQLQPQPQAHMVRWERFLPVRSLKVLLVENDDSTRHVVSALLRNCSYEVTAVPNGLEAWNILEDLNNQIDLVLSEVVMPGLSGIGLLSKIMSHGSRQTIPTIMMSSHDSMGMVLKCLSKGAADFLVKPIRKNELKNLWQHVWRKWHSSSGSGSESGIRTEKSVGAKRAEESDQNAVSNDEDDTGSVGLQVWDGSDNGSGTQSGQAFDKKKVEISNGKHSAFIRYNNGSSASNQGQTGNVGSCFPVDDSSEVVKQSDIIVPNWGITESSRDQPQAQRCYKRAQLELHSKLAKFARVELGLGIGCHYSARSSDTVARLGNRLSSVQYQSRKKIAERRARVHGQFVRQVQETKGHNADS